MGEYIYKTTPATVQEVTVMLNTGEIVTAMVGEYQFAYKPYLSDERENRRMHNRYVAPANRAFRSAGIRAPKYGVAVGDTHKHISVGDQIFDARHQVSISDYYMGRMGFVISLAPDGKDKRTLSQRIDPAIFGYSFLRPYVGDVMMIDLPDNSKLLSGDPMDYLPVWKAKLLSGDLAIFERLEQTRHPQTRLQENQ